MKKEIRSIKFRGMGVNGEWFYGNLAVLKKKLKGFNVPAGHYISNSTGSPFAYQVRPETVGQYTGLKDVNGKEIYQGDIVQRNIHREGVNPRYITKEVSFYRGAFGTKTNDDLVDNLDLAHMRSYEIIGNIHGHPHLTEGESHV